MNSEIGTISSLFLLLLVSLPISSSLLTNSTGDDVVLPRPLIIELPSSAGGTQCAESGAESDATRLFCESWRFAAEANNLAAWKAVPSECGDHVKGYLTGPGYRSDLDVVAREASAFARSVALVGDGRDVWIFDVDETLLSNLPYYAAHGYGVELFDSHQFDKWVEAATAPAIESSLKLYEEVLELGFKAVLLTGRSEAHEQMTVDNLKKAGFLDWHKLILRKPADQGKSATVYKTEKRQELESEGYRIVGNSGDQWSDLLGSSMSNRSFKLPNPMYYIP